MYSINSKEYTYIGSSLSRKSIPKQVPQKQNWVHRTYTLSTGSHCFCCADSIAMLTALSLPSFFISEWFILDKVCIFLFRFAMIFLADVHWGIKSDQYYNALWNNTQFCLLLALTSTNIEKAYDMGIIRIYRSSATHWYKFGVHTLCCSRDRAVFLLQRGKTAFLELELFLLGKIGKTALSWEQHNI